MARPGVQKHLDIAHLLRCPLCGGSLHARTSSLACSAGHDFAISAKGFANLIPQQAPLKGYDEEFFASRHRVMEAGMYRGLNEALLAAVSGLDLPDRPVIVDAGCGEGSHLKSLMRTRRISQETASRPADPSEALRGTAAEPDVDHVGIGIDIAKDAIRCAARGGGPEHWLVADLANLPLRDHSVDVILNVFTPANYAEFQRVLKPGGTLIKVVPGPEHMRELRELAGSRLSHVEAQDHGVAEHLSRHMGIVSRERVTQVSPVTPALAADLARMSPVTFGMDAGKLALDSLTVITVDAEVIIAR